MTPERSDGASPPVIPRDVGHRFREDSKQWPASPRNQWPRSVRTGGRLALESVAGLGRNTQRMSVIQDHNQNHNRTLTGTITKKYIVAEPRWLLIIAGAEAGI